MLPSFCQRKGSLDPRDVSIAIPLPQGAQEPVTGDSKGGFLGLRDSRLAVAPYHTSSILVSHIYYFFGVTKFGFQLSNTVEEIFLDQLLSIVEAANILAISPWTVRAYVQSGKLNPVRIGRRVLLEESELERFITEAKTIRRLPPQTSSVELVAGTGF